MIVFKFMYVTCTCMCVYVMCDDGCRRLFMRVKVVHQSAREDQRVYESALRAQQQRHLAVGGAAEPGEQFGCRHHQIQIVHTSVYSCKYSYINAFVWFT